MVLNPVRVKLVSQPKHWRWSSYRATAGLSLVPTYLTIDWLLAQFARRQRETQRAYQEFVGEGRGASGPWEQVRGQIYLGSEAFVAKHQPDRVLREIPRRQMQAQRPSLTTLMARRLPRERLIWQAYRRYGYRLREIAEELGCHYATISRQLKDAEQLYA